MRRSECLRRPAAHSLQIPGPSVSARGGESAPTPCSGWPATSPVRHTDRERSANAWYPDWSGTVGTGPSSNELARFAAGVGMAGVGAIGNRCGLGDPAGDWRCRGRVAVRSPADPFSGAHNGLRRRCRVTEKRAQLVRARVRRGAAFASPFRSGDCPPPNTAYDEGGVSGGMPTEQPEGDTPRLGAGSGLSGTHDDGQS